MSNSRSKKPLMMVVGNFSLVAALLLWNFGRPYAGAHAWPAGPWLDSACGLFFGISIGANLAAVRCARRSQPAGQQ
jgi:hypothetical protein